MILVTHDGKFHLDEVMATAVLLKIYPDSEIIRTRNMSVMRSGDIVYDVGGTFNPETNRYDHHQESFNETFSSKYKIKLSSSGLIYKYYGEKLLEKYGVTKTDEHFQRLLEEIYATYFLSADAIDNGYEIFGEIVPRSLSHIVESFNVLNFSGGSNNEQDRRFLEAVRFVSMDLDNFMHTIINGWMPNYKYLSELISKVDGDILCVDRYCFIDVIPEIERKYKKDINFVLKKGESSVSILAVPKKRKHFESKIPLKKEWRGLSGGKLDAISGIEGCNFVHLSGFVGSNKTIEGAIEMCKESIKAYLKEIKNADNLDKYL
ncbi:uncharacterized protein Eint_071760 [Encephalitozoon intestinalis ATCC 50506]|uniref:Metal-dependent protein hydrolase n=1 Tax=Encephalitozoon intestinalis (strain ATCC 50506) TaxID=876142 RepID=E0S8A0_ENCIT|nr:uncharacterized protein Eint_071760 [Encephalitozoon intestinalis ATCC 50506]ADM11935.1 hypothetical protein Eint_071760 [Encephalitozoon intestinalis ATCC 50506]UTX45694.1 single-stranded DNA specific exonuclease [Encephalitozoon intestinalis]